MNGKRAKAIRKKVYGDYSPRFRQYARVPGKGNLIADPKRRIYQKMKKAVKGI